MKSVIVIPVHSFVDLITNSSSELFVLNTVKSVEAVKETIEALADVYNQRCKLIDAGVWGHSEIDKSKLWTSIFKAPVASKISFSIYHFPRSEEWFDAFTRERDDLAGEHSELTPLEQMEVDMNKWEKENPAPKCVGDDETEAERKARETHWDAKYSAESRIFADWHAHVLDLHTALWNWVAQENGIDITPLGKMEIGYGGRWADARFSREAQEKASPELQEFVESVEDCMDWDYTIKKGDVILRSDSDNSIPYGFFGDIEAVFQAHRLHCG